MPDDLELPTVRRAASDFGVVGGLLIGAVSGALVWMLIGLLISAFL